MTEKDIRRPGEGGTPEQGMHAGKTATGDERGQDRKPRTEEAEGGTPDQGMRAGKVATGERRGQDR